MQSFVRLQRLATAVPRLYAVRTLAGKGNKRCKVGPAAGFKETKESSGKCEDNTPCREDNKVVDFCKAIMKEKTKHKKCSPLVACGGSGKKGDACGGSGKPICKPKQQDPAKPSSVPKTLCGGPGARSTGRTFCSPDKKKAKKKEKKICPATKPPKKTACKEEEENKPEKTSCRTEVGPNTRKFSTSAILLKSDSTDKSKASSCAAKSKQKCKGSKSEDKCGKQKKPPGSKSSCSGSKKKGGGSQCKNKKGGGSQCKIKKGGGSQSKNKKGGGSQCKNKKGGGSQCKNKKGGGSQCKNKKGGGSQCKNKKSSQDKGKIPICDKK